MGKMPEAQNFLIPPRISQFLKKKSYYKYFINTKDRKSWSCQFFDTVQMPMPDSGPITVDSYFCIVVC